MNSFEIDPEYTRVLASDLGNAAHVTLPVVPAFPTFDAFSSFAATVTAAVGNIAARTEALGADLHHLARAGHALAYAAETVDGASADSFARLQPHRGGL